MVYSCHYKGRKEKCLLKGNKYPITKGGKIDKSRVYAANTYGSRYGEITELKKAGLCKIAKQEKIKIKSCSS